MSVYRACFAACLALLAVYWVGIAADGETPPSAAPRLVCGAMLLLCLAVVMVLI